MKENLKPIANKQTEGRWRKSIAPDVVPIEEWAGESLLTASLIRF